MASTSTMITRGMKMEYRDWDVVADSAWLTFLAEIRYLGQEGAAFMAIMGTEDSKMKQLQFNLKGSTKWTYFEFYTFEVTTVDGATNMKFIDTVHKKELELQVISFRDT